MNPLRGQKGLALLETAVGLVIAAILVVPLAQILREQLRITNTITTQVTSTQQLGFSTVVFGVDATRALSFTAGQDPEYGTLSWLELSGDSPISTTVRFFFSEGTVFRELKRGGTVSPAVAILKGIEQFGDVVFEHIKPSWTFDPQSKTWSYTEGKIDVSVTTVRETAGGRAEVEFSTALTADLRPQIVLPAAFPGTLGPPPPHTSRVDYRIAGDPDLQQGDLDSGSGNDLTFDDENHYVAQGEGTPRTVIWEATSEAIDFTKITGITLEFTGQADQAGVTVQLFIFHPDDDANGNDEDEDEDEDTSPDATIIFTTPNTDETVNVVFSGDAVQHVESLGTKVARFRLQATHTGPFKLIADHLTFKVTGLPSPTFSRDYLVATSPTVEEGDLQSGDFFSLAYVDNSFYSVEEVDDVVQWIAVSEPVLLNTVSSADVALAARVSAGTPTVELFVFNPAHGGQGFAATPDATFTYSATNTLATISFSLSPEDLEFVNSLFPKEVRIRVKGADPTTDWRLEAERLSITLTR